MQPFLESLLDVSESQLIDNRCSIQIFVHDRDTWRKYVKRLVWCRDKCKNFNDALMIEL